MLIAVVGPTATGKSELALKIADALGGPEHVEIIGADAMQLYRGMDIGTAKLTVSERRGYTHHQLDVLDVSEEASVAGYQKHARSDVADIQARGKIALIVGGSGLYIRALLDEFEFPPTDPKVRARLEAEAEEVGSQSLHQRLTEVDPVAAGRIDPANARRTIRALEVIALTNRPYSASLPSLTYREPTFQIAIEVDHDQLRDRIALRARDMFRGGLVDEVEGLIPRGIRSGKTASRATGYQQALEVIDGLLSVEEAIESTTFGTRKLARRQRKWFEKDPRVQWINQGEVSRAIQLIQEAISRGAPQGSGSPS